MKGYMDAYLVVGHNSPVSCGLLETHNCMASISIKKKGCEPGL